MVIFEVVGHMRHIVIILLPLLTALQPNSGHSQGLLSPGAEDEVSRCIQRHGPVYQAGVNVTMDQAVLQVAVNFVCTALHDSEHQPSRMLAECVLPRLFLGMRFTDYANIHTACWEGLDNERLSSYFYVGMCMMKAMEDERIFDQKSAFAENARCEEIASPAESDPNYQWRPDLGR
ncbi:hypothetical protein [Roseinatronobacter ekhonensis]|nr:hypothetical protein [Roseibaca ekhonensis]